MNFLLAILIFSHLTYYNGIDDPDPRAIIGSVYPEFPADSLGLETGDEILSIDNIPISNWETMTKQIQSKPNQQIKINWLRDGIESHGYLMSKSNPQLIKDELRAIF